MTVRSEAWGTGEYPPTSALLEVAGDMFLRCDAQGRMDWADERAQEILGARPGRPFIDLATPLHRTKAEQFLSTAREQRTDVVELMCSVGGAPLLLALRGGPHGEGTLISANDLSHHYNEMHEQLTSTTNEIAMLQRESMRRERELAATHAELARASEALAEQARTQGMILSAREFAHVLNNDLALPVGLLDMLRDDEAVPAMLAPTLDEIAMGLEVAAEHLAQFSRVVSVVTKQTPIGASLDLQRSSGRPDAQ